MSVFHSDNHLPLNPISLKPLFHSPVLLYKNKRIVLPIRYLLSMYF